MILLCKHNYFYCPELLAISVVFDLLEKGLQ